MPMVSVVGNVTGEPLRILPVARISHTLPTASLESPILTVLYSLSLLKVTHPHALQEEPRSQRYVQPAPPVLRHGPL